MVLQGELLGYASNATNCEYYGDLEGTDNCGGIVGKAKTVNGCKNYGNVSGSSAIGGIVGNTGKDAVVSNLYNYGKINGTGNKVGGLIGVGGESNGRTTISGSAENHGLVSGANYVGGIMGESVHTSGGQWNVWAEFKIANYGDITGSGSYIGGIWGQYGSNAVSNLGGFYNEGKITGNSYVGGIAGYLCWNANANRCINIGDISGNNYVTGIATSATYSGKISINCCINKGNITANNNYWCIGYASSTQFSCEPSINLGSINGESKIGIAEGRTIRTTLNDTEVSSSGVSTMDEYLKSDYFLNNVLNAEHTHNESGTDVTYNTTNPCWERDETTGYPTIKK